MKFVTIRPVGLALVGLLVAGCNDSDRLQNENQRLQRQLNAEQMKTGELTREAARLAAEIRALEPELVQLRTGRAAAERKLIDAVSREEQAARWIEQREEHHLLLKQWMDRHSECSAQRDELTSRNSQVTERISSLHRTVASLKDQLEESTNNTRELRERHSVCSEERDDLTTRISRLMEDIALLERKRDSLEAQVDQVSGSAARAMQQHGECSVQLEEQAAIQARQSKVIDSLEATGKSLTGQLEELQEAKESMRVAVAEAEKQTNELDRLSAQIGILTTEQPAGVVSLLAHPELLSENDVGLWDSIELKLFSRRLGKKFTLAATMPLSMLDPRGNVKLRFGALEIVSEAWDVESRDGIVTFSFPFGERLRSAIEVSSTDIVTVEFGPRGERSLLRFRIRDWDGGLFRRDSVEFELLSVEFAGLPIAFRKTDGTWELGMR